MTQVVTTTYLEICDRSQLRASEEPRVPFALVRVEVPTPELNRFLYLAVGSGWAWRDRLPWDRVQPILLQLLMWYLLLTEWLPDPGEPLSAFGLV